MAVDVHVTTPGGWCPYDLLGSLVLSIAFVYRCVIRILCKPELDKC